MEVDLGLSADVPGFISHHHYRESGPWTGPPHTHREIELNLVESGFAALVAGGRRHALKPGSTQFHRVYRERIEGLPRPKFCVCPAGINDFNLIRLFYGKTCR